MKNKKVIITITVLLLIMVPVALYVVKKLRHKHTEFVVDIRQKSPNEKGYMLLTPYQKQFKDAGQLVIMDMDGKIYFQRKLGAIVYDFRQWVIDGKVYYTYMVDDNNAYHIAKISLTCGHVVILDSAMNEIKQVHLLPHDDIVIDKHQDLDMHDFIMFSENHYITMAVYEKNVHNIPDSLKPAPNIKVATSIIQEIRNDSVIWQWDASKYPELYPGTVIHGNFFDTSITQDYMHPNSMTLDPKDSNIILSFRCKDLVIKINRHDGKVMWRLGGPISEFPLTEEQKFKGQHHVTFEDSNRTLLMFDNGDSISRHVSRINEFRLDEVNKKVIAFKSYTIPDTFGMYMGSADKHDDHYFISLGTGQYIMDVDLRTGKKDFCMRNNLLSYRVYKVDSIYGLEKGSVKH